jgi:Tfp pilus assembly protein PilV
MNMATDPSVPTSLVAVLVIGVSALAAVIAYLFRHYQKREDAYQQERLAWVAERTRLELVETKLRAEYETRHREILETLHVAQREHENLVRREYAHNMEAVAATAQEANEKIGTVLDKFLDRFVGPRRTIKE